MFLLATLLPRSGTSHVSDGFDGSALDRVVLTGGLVGPIIRRRHCNVGWLVRVVC